MRRPAGGGTIGLFSNDFPTGKGNCRQQQLSVSGAENPNPIVNWANMAVNEKPPAVVVPYGRPNSPVTSLYGSWKRH